ncbi:barstar family protein [Streptomyces sp. NPDC050523]|uniref:barstar family protein n=1 Tax=Streptomyces sp. NPDC050523 TaxID=3365622 RepID=UPI003789EFF4
MRAKISGVTTPSLTQLTSPWVVFTAKTDPWVSAEATALLERGGLVFRLTARDLPEPASLFRTFARELSFPGYFGHNWDALVDCLHDWHDPGHDRSDVAVLIDDADALLKAEFLGVFVSVLCQAAWKANLQLDGDGVPHGDWPPFALHFVLLLEHTAPADFTEAVSKGRWLDVEFTDERLTAALSSAYWTD